MYFFSPSVLSSTLVKLTVSPWLFFTAFFISATAAPGASLEATEAGPGTAPGSSTAPRPQNRGKADWWMESAASTVEWAAKDEG